MLQSKSRARPVAEFVKVLAICQRLDPELGGQLVKLAAKLRRQGEPVVEAVFAAVGIAPKGFTNGVTLLRCPSKTNKKGD